MANAWRRVGEEDAGDLHGVTLLRSRVLGLTLRTRQGRFWLAYAELDEPESTEDRYAPSHFVTVTCLHDDVLPFHGEGHCKSCSGHALKNDFPGDFYQSEPYQPPTNVHPGWVYGI